MSNAKRQNANAARAVRQQQEITVAAQVQNYNRLTQDKSMTTPGKKHLRHQLLPSSDAMMIHLVPTAYMQETFLGTLNAMASKSTTRRKPTWELLLSL
jgi:hypothetical protein